MTLDDLQRWFQAVVTHPGGAAAGANDAEARDAIAGGSVDDIVLPSSRQSAGERLDVYARAYWARLLECLREDFPAFRSAVGEEAFDAFAFGYLQAHPSQSYTLGKLGERFPSYLTATSPPHDAWSAAVVEVARLERAINEVFDLPGGETLGFLSPDDLRRVPADRRGDARLRPLPTLRLLEFDHSVNEYYTALRASPSDAEPPLEHRPTFLAVSRRGYVVRRMPLERFQFETLRSLAAGETLARATALLGEKNVELATVERWFTEWSAAGYFQGVEI